MNVRQQNQNLNARWLSAFTLVEMLVSVALVAVLMLAVTQIFSIATRTIGGGQAIGAAVRDAQAAQNVMSRDFSSAANDGPCFIIHSKRIAAYRNQADAISDTDGNPMTYDSDGDGTEDKTVPTLTYNFRNHRIDYLMFFARDRFPRQTGGANPLAPATDPLIANETANEAAIYMHHLGLPDNAGAFQDPGAGNTSNNPNNFYASQWVLGRMAMLMVKPDATTGKILDSSGTSQTFFLRGAGLTPLSSTETVAGTKTLDTARFDLAGTSISDYAKILATYIGGNGWQSGKAYAVNDQVIYANSTYKASVVHTAAAANMPPNPGYWTSSGTAPIWYSNLMCANRFQVNPFITKPITAATASQQVPIFLPACTQFVVEFAGDFLTQNTTTGAVTAAVPDGQIDYVAGTNQIRWYGLPRDTNGNGAITASEGDVVPVSDLTGQPMSFEHVWPTSGTTAPTAANLVPTGTDYFSAAGSAKLQASPEYTVAWGPGDTNRPKLIRITIVIDRPEAAGNLLDGQTFEYVFKVGL